MLKRNRCLPNGSSGLRKHVTQRSLLGNSYNQRDGCNRGGKRSHSKHGGFHSSLWPSRSSNTRSEFSGHLREVDEDFEDDDDEVIPEDDEEDTEIDTGCKSSVRSQVGIYGGSGGTTGSSNRHSSMSSSIDAREDSSSVVMPYLSVNGVPAQSAPKRSRDIKRSPDGNDSTKNITGVKVNVVTPDQDAGSIKDCLQKASNPAVTPVADHDVGNKEQSVGSPTSILSPPDSLLGSSPVSLHSPLIGFPVPLTKSSQSIGIENDSRGDCQSPAPLPDPQPVDLQAPVLVGVSCKEDCGWIESPRVEAISLLPPDIPSMMYDDEEENTAEDDVRDHESSLSLSDATSGSSRESTISSSNYDYENCYYFASAEKLDEDKLQTPSRRGPSIYTEFVETI